MKSLYCTVEFEPCQTIFKSQDVLHTYDHFNRFRPVYFSCFNKKYNFNICLNFITVKENFFVKVVGRLKLYSFDEESFASALTSLAQPSCKNRTRKTYFLLHFKDRMEVA